MTVDPAEMWAYATRPIGEADPDAPLLAVLAAADAAEPRVVRVGDGAMVDARYEVPCPSSDTADAGMSENGPITDKPLDLFELRPDGNGHPLALNGPPHDVETDVPWAVFGGGQGVHGIVWTAPDSTVEVHDRPDIAAARIELPDTLQQSRAWWRRELNDATRLTDAKQRTRRDVAAVIT